MLLHQGQNFLLSAGRFLASLGPDDFLLAVFDPADLDLAGDGACGVEADFDVGEVEFHEVPHSGSDPAVASRAAVLDVDSF